MSSTALIPRLYNCFVIMPFGIKKYAETEPVHDFDDVWNSLNNLSSIDPKFQVRVFRADNEDVHRENLVTHVHTCIHKADFCIADITGHNPNVMYEIGFARAKGLKVFVICRKGTVIPTDLKGIVHISYTPERLDILTSDIKKHFGRITSDPAKLISKLPTVQYLARRDDELIRQKILGSKLRIDILQTNLSILEREFTDVIVSSLDAHPGLNIRILTLDPQSVFVNYRARQLSVKEVKLFRSELLTSLSATHFKLKKYGKRVSIKIYDDFPSQIAFFFDDQALACVVSAMGRSRDNCAFLVPPDLPNSRESFADHFSHLWNTKSSEYSEHGASFQPDIKDNRQ